MAYTRRLLDCAGTAAVVGDALTLVSVHTMQVISYALPPTVKQKLLCPTAVVAGSKVISERSAARKVCPVTTPSDPTYKAPSTGSGSLVMVT